MGNATDSSSIEFRQSHSPAKKSRKTNSATLKTEIFPGAIEQILSGEVNIRVSKEHPAADGSGNTFTTFETITLKTPKPGSSNDSDVPDAVEQLSLSVTENNELIKAIGLTRARPEIIAVTEFHPILTDHVPNLSFEENNFSPTPVYRLIQLNKILDIASKKSAENIINQIILPDEKDMIDAIELRPNHKNAIIHHQKKLTDPGKSEDELLKISVSNQKVSHFIKYFEFKYDNFYTRIKSNLIDSFNNNTSYEDVIITARNLYVDHLSSTVFLPTEDKSDDFYETQISRIIATATIVNNENFRNSKEFLCIIESVILKTLLKNYLSFIQEVFNLENIYKDAIDFKSLVRTYQESTLNSFSLENLSISSILQKIDKIEKINAGIAESSDNDFDNSDFLNSITPEVFSNIINSNLRFAKFNTQLFYSCYSKLISDTLFIDYTNESTISYDMQKRTGLPFAAHQRLAPKIKEIKKLSYHNISSHYIDIVEMSTNISTDGGSASNFDASVSEFKDTSISPNRFKNPMGTSVHSMQNTVENAFQKIFFDDVNTIEDRIKICCELVTSLIFDYTASARTRMLFDKSMLSSLTGTPNFPEGQEENSYNDYEFFKKYFENKTGLSLDFRSASASSNINQKFKFGVNFDSLFSENDSSLIKDSELGQVLINKTLLQQSSKDVYLLETNSLFDSNKESELGFSFYLKKALTENNFDFEDFKIAAGKFNNTNSGICLDIQNMFGLDYDQDGDISESLESNFGKANPLDFGKKLLNSLKINITSPAAVTDDIGQFDSEIQSALAILFHTLSGKDSSSLAAFSKIVGQNYLALKRKETSDGYGHQFLDLEDSLGDQVDKIDDARFENLEYDAVNTLIKEFFSEMNILSIAENPDKPIEVTYDIMADGDLDDAVSRSETARASKSDYNNDFKGSGSTTYHLGGGGANEGWETAQRFYLFLFAAFDKNFIGNTQGMGFSGFNSDYWKSFTGNYRKRLTRNTPAENIINTFFNYIEADDDDGETTLDHKDDILDSDKGGDVRDDFFNNFYIRKSKGPISYCETDAVLILSAFAGIATRYMLTKELSFERDGSDDVYKIHLSNSQMSVINKILSGGDYTETDATSEAMVIAGDPFSGGFNIQMIKDKLIKTAQRAKYIRDTLLNTINRKAHNMSKRLKGIMSVVEDVSSIQKYYEGFFSGTGGPDLVSKKSNRLLKNMLEQQPNFNDNTLEENSRFFNKSYGKAYLAGLNEYIESSSKNALFSPIKVYSDKQVKLMTIAFNKSNSNLHVNGKRSTSSIFTVGLTNNMIAALRSAATKNSNDEDYKSAKYIVIEIYKNSIDTAEQSSFIPKFYVFDITKFALSDTDTLKSKQIENFNEIKNYNDLKNNFSLYDINLSDLDNPVKTTGKEMIDSVVSNEKKIAMSQIVDNHIFDHYLKMYVYLTQGITLSAHNFPVHSDSIDRLTEADIDKQEIFKRFKEGITLKYPSINVDQNLLFEFNRIEKQIQDSIILKSRNKANYILAPKCFDRTFSFIVNDDDFIHKSKDYTGGLANNINCSLNIPEGSIFNVPADSIDNFHLKSHTEIINSNKVIPSLHQYYCVVSICKDLPELSNSYEE